MKLGIDLGTYNSGGSAALDKNHIVMIESVNGRTLLYGKRFPSFVYFNHQGEVIEVGERAKRELAEKPALVVWGVKRLVGLSYKEADESEDLKRFGYRILPSEDGGIQIEVGPRLYRPQDILSIILRTIKQDAENLHANPETGGRQIDSVVISVPAYFSTWRTNPICDAARDAGFTEVSTIAEPTAAALCHSLAIQESLVENKKKDSIVMTFDLGAGTLDVTILKLQLKGDDMVRGVLSVSGDARLGGIDMDEVLATNWSQAFGVSDDPKSRNRFREDVERAKIRLSKSERTTLDLPMGGNAEITRGRLESDLKGLLEKCRGPIRDALKFAELPAQSIDYVLFVGGPTHMPCVRAVVADELKRLGACDSLLAQIASYEGGFPVDPMDCVSQGAALKALGEAAPGLTPFPDGYGTILGHARYGEILPPNSRYPITSKPFPIRHSNPNARRVPVVIVAKEPRRGTPGTSELEYGYRHLGELGLAINPTGELPSVSITIGIDGDKRTWVTLQHTQSGQPVTYRALHRLTGFDINLHEEDIEGVEIDAGTGGTTSAKPPLWTKEDLAAHLHSARALLDHLSSTAASSSHTVRQIQRELEEEVQTAAEAQTPGSCPALWNKAQSLASAMSEAHLIGKDGYLAIKSDLDRLHTVGP